MCIRVRPGCAAESSDRLLSDNVVGMGQVSPKPSFRPGDRGVEVRVADLVHHRVTWVGTMPLQHFGHALFNRHATAVGTDGLVGRACRRPVTSGKVRSHTESGTGSRWMTEDSHSAGPSSTGRGPQFTRILMTGACALGALVNLYLAGYALVEHSWRPYVVGALAGLAAVAVGLGIGFLFGLPRFPATPEPRPVSAASQDRSRPPAEHLLPSSNLGQVADWLTKILIGAGLVQLGAAGGALGRLSRQVGRAFTDHGGPPSESAVIVAGATLVVSAVVGFLVGFLAAMTSVARVIDWYWQQNQDELADRPSEDT